MLRFDGYHDHPGNQQAAERGASQEVPGFDQEDDDGEDHEEGRQELRESDRHHHGGESNSRRIQNERPEVSSESAV